MGKGGFLFADLDVAPDFFGGLGIDDRAEVSGGIFRVTNVQ